MTTKNKKELLDLATGFNDFAKKHSWISRYDAESSGIFVKFGI